MPDDAFFDDDHMHRDAALEFTARLAPWIAAAGRGEPAPELAGCAALR
jgi:hypothetical protein